MPPGKARGLFHNFEFLILPLSCGCQPFAASHGEKLGR
jgi:hypothetical protein